MNVYIKRELVHILPVVILTIVNNVAVANIRDMLNGNLFLALYTFDFPIDSSPAHILLLLTLIWRRLFVRNANIHTFLTQYCLSSGTFANALIHYIGNAAREDE